MAVTKKRAAGGIVLALGAAAVLYIISSKGRPGRNGATNGKKSKTNSEHILSLHPKIREKVREFIRQAKAAGYDLIITSSLRTFGRQNQLYAQGRTTKGKIVTNAKGGESFHNYGLAIDAVPINKGIGIADINKIAAIAKKLGFKWGGDWKGFRDIVHYEMTFGNSIAMIQKKHKAGKYKDNYLQLV